MRKWQKTALLAAAAVFAAWMLWPRPLAKAFDAEQGLAASVTASGVRDGRAWMDSSEQYDLEEGCAALREVLEGYSYHLCLDTLTGENAIDGKGGTDHTVHLYNVSAQSLISNGTARIFVDGRVYRVGSLGSRRGTALNRDILAAPRGECLLLQMAKNGL